MVLPPIVLAVVNILNLVTAATPAAQKIYAQARELFKLWFAGGVITKAQADTLHAWADQHEEKTLKGEVPDALLVEADPT